MRVIGIDPGFKGGIACFDSKYKILSIYDTPIIKIKVGKSIRSEYNEDEMRRILVSLDPYIAYIEKQHAMKGQGVTSMFSTGLGYGIWRGMLKGLDIKAVKVPARTWQKEFFKGIGDTKNQSYNAAIKLYPKYKDIFVGPKGGKKDGRCDAVLIATYGLKQHIVKFA